MTRDQVRLAGSGITPDDKVPKINVQRTLTRDLRTGNAPDVEEPDVCPPS